MMKRLNAPAFLGIYDFEGGQMATLSKDPDYNVKQDYRLQLISSTYKGQTHACQFKKSGRSIIVMILGEVYNRPELCDECSIPQSERQNVSLQSLCYRLYDVFGMNFIKRLNGQFSMVFRDEKQDLLMIGVDRFGLSRPVYYHEDGNLIFSSHLKAILEYSNLTRSIDTQALALFLKYAYIPSPKTIFQGVNKLGPGERIVCQGGDYRVERYIDFEQERRQIDENEAIEEYTRLLKKSLSRRLGEGEHGRIGIFLSGGLDSSANVALASNLARGRVESFGIGFADQKVDERPFARIAADHYGIPFHDYLFDGREIEELPGMLWYLEEPFMENGLFLTYAGFKSAYSRVDTVLTGNCTDQLFGTGGFTGGLPIALRYVVDKARLGPVVQLMLASTRNNWFYCDNLLFKIKVMLERVSDFNEWFFWGFDDSQLKKLCTFPIDANKLKIFPNNIHEGGADFDTYYQHSLIHQDLEHYACQNVIVKTHRMAEMFGIVARDPYLDYDLVDFVLSLDLNLKRRGALKDYFLGKTIAKYLHRRAMKNVLPQKILSKPKQGGFVSMDLLLNDYSKRKQIIRYILGSEMINEYLHFDAVKGLLRQHEELVSRKVYWANHRESMANRVLYLLTLAHWYDVFCKNSTRKPHYSRLI